MKQHCWSLALACGIGLAVASSAVTTAQVPAAAAPDAFIGTWKLLRQEARNVESNETIPAQTSDQWPGLLVYAPDGWMSVSIDRRPTGGSYWGYFGTFSVAGDTITHDIAGGVPSARGPSPARYRFEDDGRTLVISTLPSGGVVVHFHFARAAAAK